MCTPNPVHAGNPTVSVTPIAKPLEDLQLKANITELNVDTREIQDLLWTFEPTMDAEMRELQMQEMPGLDPRYMPVVLTMVKSADDQQDMSVERAQEMGFCGGVAGAGGADQGPLRGSPRGGLSLFIF